MIAVYKRDDNKANCNYWGNTRYTAKVGYK